MNIEKERKALEPVAWYHPSDDGYDSSFRDHSTVLACSGNTWDGFLPLITTDQAKAYADARVREALEQAVLQSPEVQALRKDAERYQYIRKGNHWIVTSTQTGVQIGGEELDNLIDDDLEKQK